MKRFMILLLLAQVAQAQVYKWVDDNGKVHYSDEIPEGRDVLEENIEIKNSQIQIMGEKDMQLLETYDTDREQRKEANKLEQKRLDQEASKSANVVNKKVSLPEKHRCFGPSPSSTPSGVSHLEVNARELGDEQIETLKNIFDKIRGNWRGTAEGVTCLGTVETPKLKPEDFNLRVEARVDFSSTLRIEADLESKHGGSRRSEKYDFHLEDDFLRLNFFGKGGDIELRHLTKEGFTILQKKWHRNIFVETLIAINLNGNALIIERINYANGILGGVSVWALEKY
ncbi:MAG: DUF4124 domain-containing protein [Pseudomonadales bacterium]|nr:DUF4124 domain-containing protein [Pseudomonadales bacterium]MCP5216001.1 DUF4124 domain-containing protein [Pseudomonadales bacterium]